MNRRTTVTRLTAAAMALAMATAVIAPQIAQAHCQIPCGIYGDATRFTIIEEHITTIEKSMNQINELSGSAENSNQVVRWVMNKDQHADEIAEIITKYFLQQRIKPEEAETDHASWMAKVTACHHILVSSMKAKQTTDLEHVKALRKHLEDFRNAYFTEEELAHQKEHQN